MQPQSHIRKLLIQDSYRLHKQRLSQIKRHDVSLQLCSSSKSKPEDRKKLLMLQMRKQEIDHDNSILNSKINKIRGRDSRADSFREDYDHRHKKIRNSRYKQENEEELCDNNPIQFTQDGDIKCILPAPYQGKPKNNYFNPQSETGKALNLSLVSSNKLDNETSIITGNQIKEWQNGKETKNNAHQTANITGRRSVQDPIVSNEEDNQFPEAVADRVVIYKKTTFLGDMSSCLLEISKINRKLLFMAYVMGIENYTSKLFLDEVRSAYLLKLCAGDYSQLGSKVSIDIHRTIKLSGLAPPPEKETLQSIVALGLNPEKGRKIHLSKQQQLKVQQNFVKRNHFTRERGNKTAETIDNSRRPNVSSSQTNKHNQTLVEKPQLIDISGISHGAFIKRFNADHQKILRGDYDENFCEAITKRKSREKKKPSVDIAELTSRLAKPNRYKKDANGDIRVEKDNLLAKPRKHEKLNPIKMKVAKINHIVNSSLASDKEIDEKESVHLESNQKSISQLESLQKDENQQKKSQQNSQEGQNQYESEESFEQELQKSKEPIDKTINNQSNVYEEDFDNNPSQLKSADNNKSQLKKQKAEEEDDDEGYEELIIQDNQEVSQKNYEEEDEFPQENKDEYGDQEFLESEKKKEIDQEEVYDEEFNQNVESQPKDDYGQDFEEAEKSPGKK